MKIKDLQGENEWLRKELEDMRESDICTFLWSWDMFQENRRLWEIVDGMACPWYGPGLETCEV